VLAQPPISRNDDAIFYARCLRTRRRYVGGRIGTLLDLSLTDIDSRNIIPHKRASAATLNKQTNPCVSGHYGCGDRNSKTAPAKRSYLPTSGRDGSIHQIKLCGRS